MEREGKKAVTSLSCLLSPVASGRRSPAWCFFAPVLLPRVTRSQSDWFELAVRLGWCEPLVPVEESTTTGKCNHYNLFQEIL